MPGLIYVCLSEVNQRVVTQFAHVGHCEIQIYGNIKSYAYNDILSEFKLT